MLSLDGLLSRKCWADVRHPQRGKLLLLERYPTLGEPKKSLSLQQQWSNKSIGNEALTKLRILFLTKQLRLFERSWN